MSDSTTTTVSLPPHLITKLEAVIDILPDELKDALLIPLKERVEIAYSILLKISQWVRTDNARRPLSTKQLDANDYTMISLLAGTITSPLSNFPKPDPPENPAETAQKNMSDRRAIVALVNALFSIAGAGYASWYVSQHVGWRHEWRALFALTVALVLALTEAILFIMWQSRAEKSHLKGIHLKFDRAKEKKEPSGDTGTAEITPVPITKEKNSMRLRKRRTEGGH